MDEGLCEQAFINIIQNAYDAMSANGGGVLRVAVKAARRSVRDRNNVDGVEVRIADTGWEPRFSRPKPLRWKTRLHTELDQKGHQPLRQECGTE